MLKNVKLILTFISLISMTLAGYSVALEESSFSQYDTGLECNAIRPVYEVHRPQHVTRLMMELPEYKATGPGHVCELRQPQPVVRESQPYMRNVFYREANWSRNMRY